MSQKIQNPILQVPNPDAQVQNNMQNQAPLPTVTATPSLVAI